MVRDILERRFPSRSGKAGEPVGGSEPEISLAA